MGKLNVNLKNNKVNTEISDEISKMQKLDSLLQTFFEKFDEARTARWNILEFLEDEYEEKDGKMVFSTSGSIWNPSGTDIEAGGQILDTIANYIDDPVFMEIHRLWKLYHLNDMHPECEHQRELGWNEIAKRSVNIYHYHITRDALRKQNEAKNKALAALKNGETFTPTKEDTFYANLSYSLKSST